jgi:hypothetical protein
MVVAIQKELHRGCAPAAHERGASALDFLQPPKGSRHGKAERKFRSCSSSKNVAAARASGRGLDLDDALTPLQTGAPEASWPPNTTGPGTLDYALRGCLCWRFAQG